MFAEPTIHDHLTQVNLRLQEARERLARGTNKVEAEFAAKGSYHSGAIVKALGRVATEEFDRTVSEVLGELTRSIKATTIDEDELRLVTYQQLEAFAREMRTHSKLEKFERIQHLGAPFLAEVVERFPSRLGTYLRQFDVGLFGKATPEVLSVTNNHLNVGVNVGAIQQGSHGSTQNAPVSLNVGSIRSVLDAFERELASAAVTTEARASLEADVATIRVQLKKPSLSETILREAGLSIRNVVEGLAAGMMTPQAIAAATALAASLGAA